MLDALPSISVSFFLISVFVITVTWMVSFYLGIHSVLDLFPSVSGPLFILLLCYLILQVLFLFSPCSA